MTKPGVKETAWKVFHSHYSQMEQTKRIVEAEFKEMTTGKPVKPRPIQNLKFLSKSDEENKADDREK